MQDNYVVAGKGLQLMFCGAIVCLVGALLAWIPLVGLISDLLALAGSLISLYGLYISMGAHPNFKLAMYATIAVFVLSVLGLFAHGVMAGVLGIAKTALGFLQVYYICTAASALLTSKGDQLQANKANLIITLNLICSVVIILCSLVAWIPVVNVLAGIVAGLSGIVALVTLVLQLIFYYKSSQSLLA